MKHIETWFKIIGLECQESFFYARLGNWGIFGPKFNSFIFSINPVLDF